MNRFGLPNLGIGIGLRAVHYAQVLAQQPPVDWFEIISENFMESSGRPIEYLDRIAERYPVTMHGVSLSIGSADPIDYEYLRGLKRLRDRVGALWVSDHLCWTGMAGVNTHDLLPMPYTDEALEHVSRRVRAVQDYLEVPLVLENPSTYLEFRCSMMPEWEFLTELVRETDCGLLLDVNNVFVSAHNHGFDPMIYLAHIPYASVVQFHVAGHTHEGAHIIDTHIGPVAEPVWALLEHAYAASEGASVLLEWDAEIPTLDIVCAEAMRAKAFIVTDVVDGAEARVA